MEMNQYYHTGHVSNSGNVQQQYPTYNGWTSGCAKSENYDSAMLFGESFDACANQTNSFFQYGQMAQNINNNNQAPAMTQQNPPVTMNASGKHKDDSEDSPALRALLTNPEKKIKYNPNYYDHIRQTNKSDEIKIKQIKDSLTSLETQVKPPAATLSRSQLTPVFDAAVLSPQCSEPEYQSDYLHATYSAIPQTVVKDEFTPPAMSNPPSVLPEISAGSPFEISPPPSASSVSSTISNSPPPSPINQKYAMSSQNMTPASWLLNGGAHQSAVANPTQHPWMSKSDAESYLTDETKSKRSRQTYSRSQTHALELSFFKSTYLSRQRRSELSKELNLTERQVKIWFQNRRMKEKKVKGTLSEKKNLPQPSFMAQPPLGYAKSAVAAAAAAAVAATTGSYQQPGGYPRSTNASSVPRPLPHTVQTQSSFNVVSSTAIPGQFMPPSSFDFPKPNALPSAMEHHFPQQSFSTNQYHPQFPHPHQNAHNYLAPTCNYGQYPIRPSTMSSSTDFPIAPNVFAG